MSQAADAAGLVAFASAVKDGGLAPALDNATLVATVFAPSAFIVAVPAGWAYWRFYWRVYGRSIMGVFQKLTQPPRFAHSSSPLPPRPR